MHTNTTFLRVRDHNTLTFVLRNEIHKKEPTKNYKMQKIVFFLLKTSTIYKLCDTIKHMRVCWCADSFCLASVCARTFRIYDFNKNQHYNIVFNKT